MSREDWRVERGLVSRERTGELGRGLVSQGEELVS